MSWRLTLEAQTRSASTSETCPMPVRTSASAHQLPTPPVPTSRTRVPANARIAGRPTSSSVRWNMPSSASSVAMGKRISEKRRMVKGGLTWYTIPARRKDDNGQAGDAGRHRGDGVRPRRRRFSRDDRAGARQDEGGRNAALRVEGDAGMPVAGDVLRARGRPRVRRLRHRHEGHGHQGVVPGPRPREGDPERDRGEGGEAGVPLRPSRLLEALLRHEDDRPGLQDGRCHNEGRQVEGARAAV